ncbi:MAG TPA: hypothetical protein VG389_05945 [Myxococcota bacterium]|jgi:hypothetical protein|nr:hypothetical protein [Myxococcota bacterium]
MAKEPAGTDGVVDVQFNVESSSFEVTVDVLKGAVEASPNADFRLQTSLNGDGLIVTGGCPLADTKPVSDTGGTARVVQNVPYSGGSGTFAISVTSQVTKGDSTNVGQAATGSFTVVVP